MLIQSYQIHNVLNVYRRQLSQSKTNPVGNSGNRDTGSDTVQISMEGKSQSIMKKVADNVLKKITNVEPGFDFGQEMAAKVRSDAGYTSTVEKDSQFVFNTIEGDNRKETRSIAVDDSQVLMDRLNELAKAAVDRKSQ
ncbi:DVU0524 family FlgM-associated protein [uncultured Desulfosarcina sp.]|uniref:DVU0524 family FlgM-associated protein n=1 Tax=uncultured Desulfosarcina sp. TaxID=218289 RepID=UPI0029C709C6|nr:DVU0524 family FlgM-associated protein [uncultured Desulfosarcina sp.]